MAIKRLYDVMLPIIELLAQELYNAASYTCVEKDAQGDVRHSTRLMWLHLFVPGNRLC